MSAQQVHPLLLPELVGRIMQYCDCMRDFYALATVSRAIAAVADAAIRVYIDSADYKMCQTGCDVVDMHGSLRFLYGWSWFLLSMGGRYRGAKYLRWTIDYLDAKYSCK